MTPGDWVSNNGCGMTVGHCLNIVVLEIYVLSLRELIIIIIFIVIK